MWNFGPNWPHPPSKKTDISNRYSLVAPQPLLLTEKTSIIANRRSTTGFPMSLGRTAYVAPKPPKGGLKTQNVRLPYKGGLLSKKVCYKVYLCEIFQQQSCKAFIGLSICSAQIVVGGVASYLKFWAKLTNPLKNADFESIFARSALRFTAREKSSIITNTKTTTGFLMNLRWTAYVASKPPTLQRGLSAIAEFLVSFL